MLVSFEREYMMYHTVFFLQKQGEITMFIYPDNLKAKPMLWLWLLRDIAVIGVAALLSVLALSQGLGMGLLVVTVL